jgi:dynein heavy chain
VRTNLTKLQSITLGALIVIDVHAKDVIADLVTAGIENPDDFEWSSQLRYYWDPEQDDLFVRCI